MVDIRRLDEATVERIAAGEVVERPASAVKELVENSLDADAGRVEVRVESGGTDGIVVSDDGVGMTGEELRRAVEEHTTSKIRDIDDLEAGVGTLGFRGEALHAIGAVSRLTITTRPRPDRSDVEAARGTRLRVEGGEVTDVEPAGRPPGTTVEVEDLFYNVPARRKYLKQDATEFAHVNTVVARYALANPDVAVSLTHGDHETFATTGTGDRREAVMSVYGREVADAMIDVDARVGGRSDDGGADGSDGENADGDANEDTLPEGPLDAVEGLVSHPETTRASRDYLATYVNGRYVTAGAVREAVVAAYDTQLAPDRYPFAVLFLDVPVGEVDVNVHPRKLEVRWVDEEAVARQVRTAVGNALRSAGILRSSAPRGRSAPEQTAIDPSSASGDADGATTGRGDADGAGADRTGASGRDRSARSNADTTNTTQDGTGGQADATEPSGAESSDPPTGGTPDTRRVPSRQSSRSSVASSTPESSAADSSPSSSSASSTADSTPSTPHERRTGVPGVTEPGTQKTLRGEDAHETTAFDAVPDLRVLGQLHDTYVVAEADDGLVLIDQHAADERINYERLREQFEGETTTQALAEPVEIAVTAKEAELFGTSEEALARLGFVADRVDDRTLEVKTVPSLVAESAGPEVVRDVLSELVTGTDAAARTVEAVADELLADMACYPSITGNTSLTDGSVVDLLSALDDCENPWACPHGRPVLITIDSEEIDDRFERDYPGHAGRRD